VPGTNQPRQIPEGAQRQLAGTGPLAGTPTPVAAGFIRMISDRRPNVATPGAADATGQQQPTNDEPPASNQPADAATPPAQTPNQ
jgi:hypothetical protein